MTKKYNIKPRIFALYKGDTYIMDGTVSEIAARLGISEFSVRMYHTPTYQKRTKSNGNARRLVRID